MPKRHTADAEFTEFAMARAPALYRSAWLLCRDHHRAEDLVQETLAKVYARWHRPFSRPIDNPAAYAQTALMRTHISQARRGSSKERAYAEPPEQSVNDTSQASTSRLALLDALGELSATDRAVVTLRYLEDLSVEATAERLRMSAGSVRNRSMRALKKLRDVIDVPETTSYAWLNTGLHEGSRHD